MVEWNKAPNNNNNNNNNTQIKYSVLSFKPHTVGQNSKTNGIFFLFVWVVSFFVGIFNIFLLLLVVVKKIM